MSETVEQHIRRILNEEIWIDYDQFGGAIIQGKDTAARRILMEVAAE